MKKRFPFLTRNIVLLSTVSFFTDVASEMLYPIMPIYLSSIGYGVLTVGIIEGMAEAVSGLNKVFIGHISDKLGKRNLFVRIGYGLSAFSKPLIGFSKNAPFIFFIRFLDRVGKGIRTSPRDAILTAESKPEVRGRVFGFHRSMDTFGAMLGPILTLAFIYFYPSQYTKLFLYALIPGAIAFTFTMILSKEKKIVPSAKPKHSIADFKNFWKKSSPTYRKLLIGFLFLAVINSTNAFLLLRVKGLGFPDTYVIGSYIFYNLIFALASYPLGSLGDKLGFKPLFIAGMLIFSLVYSVLGQGFSSPWILLGLFGLYGIFGAVDEGMTKAWLTLHIAPEYKATGLGLHLTLSSLGFLVASVVTAFLWNMTGPKVVFSFVALLGLLVIGYFSFLKEEEMI